MSLLARHDFSSPEEMSASISGADVEFLALGRSRYRSSLTAFQLRHFRIQSVQDSPHCARGHVAGDIAMLLFMLEPGASARVNSERIEFSDVAILGAGADLRTSLAAPVGWATIALPLALAETIGEAGAPVPGRIGVVRNLLRRTPQLLDVLRSIIGTAERAPELLAMPAAAEAMSDSLQAQVRRALLGGVFRDRVPRAVRGRMRTARLLDEYLAADPWTPVSTMRLCGALGVSERSLRDAIAAVQGVSVHTYLRLRRLEGARAALLGEPEGPGRLKKVALTCGFLHLGRFAEAYSRRFGELPSATRAR